jgi:acyl-CoA reductase-like NAD-dependent aldehyde dehydrogenase
MPSFRHGPASKRDSKIQWGWALIRTGLAGTVWINTWHRYHPNAPFGGYNKMSGYGREQGAEALESYTQYKSVWANLA